MDTSHIQYKIKFAKKELVRLGTTRKFLIMQAKNTTSISELELLNEELSLIHNKIVEQERIINHAIKQLRKGATTC